MDPEDIFQYILRIGVASHTPLLSLSLSFLFVVVACREHTRSNSVEGVEDFRSVLVQLGASFCGVKILEFEFNRLCRHPLTKPRSLERSQIRVEGRKKKIDRHGTGGALEEFGSGLGWSRVWCRMVVLGRCGCLQSGCHCPLPALSTWSVLSFVCCFLFLCCIFLFLRWIP